MASPNPLADLTTDIETLVRNLSATELMSGKLLQGLRKRAINLTEVMRRDGAGDDMVKACLQGPADLHEEFLKLRHRWELVLAVLEDYCRR